MRVVVFWEDQYPFVDCPRPHRESLEAAFEGSVALQFVAARHLSAALDEMPDVFVNPYGSAFPKSEWLSILKFLQAGGNFVNLGGAPFTRPVRLEGDEWRLESAQTAYGKRLGINQSFPIDLPDTIQLRCLALDADLETHFHLYRPHRAWSFQIRFTSTRDYDEDGTSGRRDAILRPLITAEENGCVVAAPIVSIDRTLGEFAGGRWVFAACQSAHPLPADLIHNLCHFAARPRATLHVQSSYACYYRGEHATVRVAAQSPSPLDMRISVRVFSEKTQKEIYAHVFKSHSGVGPAIVLSSPFSAGEPGLYHVRVTVEAPNHNKPIAFAENGFWVYDRNLMTSGLPLKIDGDYFTRDSTPVPITGTTYMASDSHRKFLFEPNPANWDADFKAMKAAGVNMVRTGMWTGWRRAMLDSGAVDEGVLRAFAAWMHCAKRYDIPVTFTFFAFLPEAWGGENPYLDPASVAAQSMFIAAFARRFAEVPDLSWDLINEPSFCSPKSIWQTRPNGDRFERMAWAKWVLDHGRSEDEWRERWRLTPEDSLKLPELADFDDRYIFQGTHPIRVMDYKLFAQQMFAEWAAKLNAVIRENGNPGQLITVGQDEGGTRDRPGPAFHFHVVDFTTNHSWWQNDDLLWDSVITKSPGVPNLIQETGIMFVEQVDGSYLRSPEQARNLLERKMALSFAAGCAGFIQWLWNTNLYMDSDNEVGIGFLRADTSEKPELQAFRGVAKFMAENADKMRGRIDEEICIVLPQSNGFSVRNHSDLATRRAVRVLEYELGVPCRSIGEYQADQMGKPKLIVLPSPRVLTNDCWNILMDRVGTGATLLTSGFLEADEHWRPVPRLRAFGLETSASPVLPLEECGSVAPLDGKMKFEFGGDDIQKIDKAVGIGGIPIRMQVFQHGEGQIIYSPIPVEMSKPRSGEATPIFEFYAQALALADVHDFPSLGFPGLLCRPVVFASHILFLLVNESAADIRLPDSHGEGYPGNIKIPAGRIAMAFVDIESGQTVARYEVI